MIFDGSAFRLLLSRAFQPAARPVRVCSMVFDPNEDLYNSPFVALSSVGRSLAASLRGGAGTPDAADALSLAKRLTSDGTVDVVDPTDEEMLTSRLVSLEAKQRRPLGIATAAAVTVAIARHRHFEVATADSDLIGFLEGAGESFHQLP
jgi:hypothetical protein